MKELLSRDDFRKSVFERDGLHCAFCSKPAVDAHHILDRKLFPDGGYYLDNGVAVCEEHHIDCEMGRITPQQIYEQCRITEPALPPGFKQGIAYNKWGQAMSEERYKYPRTPHFPWSPGFSGDDERLADVSQFEGMDIVITEKLDGENTTIYSDGYIHARSMSGTSHPWQAWVKREMAPAAQDLPRGWRLCGENLYGIHSIEYSKLPSFFFIFAIIDDQNIDLAWDEVEEFAGLLDVPTVPVIYKGPWDEELVKNLTLQESRFGKDVEGYVMRNAKRFSMNDYGRNVAKYVRKGHIQTDEHWTKNWKPAKLGDLE